MREEIWKDIKGYVGLYQVSNLGRVKSLMFRGKPRDVIMGGCLVNSKSRQYLGVNLCKKGSEPWLATIHRLVALAFIPNPLQLTDVDHINNDPLDNQLSNLQWLSTKDNVCKERAKTVYQYSLDNKLVKIWPSTRECGRKLT